MNSMRAAIVVLLATALETGSIASAEDLATVAKAFGARETIRQISLSPDGSHVAFVAPVQGAGTALMVADPVVGGAPVSVLASSGLPDKLHSCNWITPTRLACEILYLNELNGVPVVRSRMVAVDSDGKRYMELSAPESESALGVHYFGGRIIDWTGDGSGTVLMTREYVPESSNGTLIHNDNVGLGVERVDTRNHARAVVEKPRRDAAGYITDGRGTVRIMATRPLTGSGYQDTKSRYYYRTPGASEWRPLSVVDELSVIPADFEPLAIDPDKNIAYGFMAKDGYKALFSTSLDGALTRQLVMARPNTDIDGLLRKANIASSV